MRLLCFPYAGRGAATFWSWCRVAPETVEVCPVQLPGRDARHDERPYSAVEPLVEALCDGLAPWLEQPFALFGSSMGALIAFEFARALSRRSLPRPAHVFLAARRGPGRPAPRKPIRHLPDDEFLEEVGTCAGTPPEILADRAVMQFYLPLLRADFALCERYTYRSGPPLQSPVTVLGGRMDPDVSLRDLVAWRAATRASFNLWLFSGDHFFVHSCGAEVLRLIVEQLERRDNRRDEELRPVARETLSAIAQTRR